MDPGRSGELQQRHHPFTCAARIAGAYVFVSQMAFPGADGDTLPDIDGNEADYDIESYELEPGDMLGRHHLTAVA